MKSLLLLIILSFFFSSCLQNKMAVKQLMKTMGKNADFYRPLTNNEFKRLLKNTNIKDNQEISNCLPSLNQILDKEIQKELSALSGKVCDCKPWGQCGKEVCSCDTLCPDSLKIFEKPTTKDGSFHMDQLSFDNADVDLLKGGSQGYCWGLSVLSQKFQRLAQFKPLEEKAYSLKDFNPQRKEYFRDIIKKISNNEVVEIPGFSSLHEFSSLPEVKELLIESTRKIWVESAMTSQGVNFVLNKKQMSQADFNNLADDIKTRTDLKLSPTIVFNGKDDRGLIIHALQVTSVITNSDGSKTLCIVDNSLPAIYSTNCNQKINYKNGTMALTLDNQIPGTIYSIPKIMRIEIAHTEDSNIIEQAHNLKKKCETEKDCPSRQ